MVDIQAMKYPNRWILFLLVTGMIITIAGLISYSLINYHNNLTISITGGIISGAILIAFDIIVIQGLEWEDNKKEERLKTIFKDSIKGYEFRQVLRKEINDALNEDNNPKKGS